MSTTIPGYTYGTDAVPRSPLTLEQLDLLKRTVTLGDDDVAALRRSRALLEPRVDEVLDVWYGFVASQPHLLRFFAGRETGEPIGEYLERVRARFGRWILDTAAAEYDQAWLDYQHEIGRRHHRGKNETDGVDSVPTIDLRYVIALVHPITATLRPFLAAPGVAPDELERMHDAWRKAVVLQVALWSEAYAG
ncbi:MAG TPA: protoglobin domain-containing protein [Gaiellaceae bacterium]|nr:protoglobin domain-containing protein [Gaiellaceae bacterium]